jgi:hypothetical protein
MLSRFRVCDYIHGEEWLAQDRKGFYMDISAVVLYMDNEAKGWTTEGSEFESR